MIKIMMKLIFTGVLPIVLISNATAARVDMPKPGKEPVKSVEITEKGDSVTMKIEVSKKFNFSAKIESIYIFISEPKKASKEVKYTVNKGLWTWIFSFTLPKDKIDFAKINLTYRQKGVGGDFGEGTNVVHLKLEDYYNHYKKKNEK